MAKQRKIERTLVSMFGEDCILNECWPEPHHRAASSVHWKRSEQDHKQKQRPPLSSLQCTSRRNERKKGLDVVVVVVMEVE